jgi:predicted ATPase
MNTENNSGFKWESRLTSLRKWRLNSFKSVAHQVEVDLAPLTVVVGANSSGKSTLIQSILLMAQNAMRSDERSTPKSRGIFELNGPLVQLGTFRETACDLARTNNSYLEFGGLWFASDRIVRSNEFNDSASSGFTRVGEQSLVWDLKLRPIGKELDSGLGIVESSLVESYRKGSLEEKSEVSFRSSKQDIELLRSKYERFSFEHNAKKEDHRKGRSSKENSAKSRLDAVTFQAGLPTSGLVKKNVVEYMFECQEELFSEAIVMGYSKDPDSENSQDVAKQYDSIESVIEDYVIQLADFGKRIVQQDRSSEDRGVASLSRIIEQNLLIPIEQFPEDSLKYFGTEVSTFEETLQKTANTLFQVRFMEGLRSRFDELFGDAEWTQEETYCLPSGRRSANPELDSPGSSSTLPRLIKYWNRYLSENVLYLGPLRVGPRATYGIGSTIENYNLPLGESGEFLAKKMFTDKTPKAYPIVDRGQLRDSRMTLEEAVTLWYQELSSTDETNEISVEAPNRQGYPLKIGKRTLANVGFGASQILPVLGLCLSASPGDLILLEQPELHLNPGMQQKLADFLLFMSRTGRQIIVETHSEYLITRLRRNAASTPDDHKYFTVIYVERDPEAGTSYRTVSVDDQGDLSEWPKGFFDHVAEDLRVLMRRAAERQSGKTEK